jgi:hypothetical protein
MNFYQAIATKYFSDCQTQLKAVYLNIRRSDFLGGKGKPPLVSSRTIVAGYAAIPLTMVSFRATRGKCRGLRKNEKFWDGILIIYGKATPAHPGKWRFDTPRLPAQKWH